jgi:hypothetical protein
VTRVTAPAAFSPDYFTARDRFRAGIQRLGWILERHPIATRGPNGEELTIDVGFSSTLPAERMVVLSSGLHGVEGLFGSAIQAALLDQWVEAGPPTVRCVLLHGLNPYGFAWRRRFDERNVDPNRNFLLPGEPYAGAPAGYAALNALLNPQRPPSSWEPFTLKALWQIARHGRPALKQAIAAGQYEFPQGLFYGGAEPSESHRILADHLPRWLAGSRDVVHLDFHTGLGAYGMWKLLLDYPLSAEQAARLTKWYGPNSFEGPETAGVAYDTRGGLGRWCTSQSLAANYLYACAEFGTYGPVKMLAGLRAENQAHHWTAATSSVADRAKRRLSDLFCPPDLNWRSHVLEQGVMLVERTIRGMTIR